MSRKCFALPSPLSLREKYPAATHQIAYIQKQRDAVASILQGNDPRKILVVGPCSVHTISGTLHYAKQLAELAKEVEEQFLVIMRVYYEKPRTSLGWKGLLHDPFMDGSYNLEEGIRRVRSLLVSLAKMQVPAAAELLSPFALPYFQDLLTWGCIGARTAESQTHRELASCAPFPMGVKNPTSGITTPAIHALVSVSSPQNMFTIDDKGYCAYSFSNGNPHSLLVLRGGNEGPNYTPESIKNIQRELEDHFLAPNVMIDCSHDNSGKDPYKQIPVFHSALNQIIDGNDAIKGIMLESYLESGTQSKGYCSTHHSYTDPCLDWKSTKSLIRYGFQSLRAVKEECACV